nr:immunoglobulin light chain junction region [Macaca mulatta]
CMQGLEYLLTF